MAEGYSYHMTEGYSYHTDGATQFPSVRPTGASVFRESITDERKRQERLSESCTPSRDTDATCRRRPSVSTNDVIKSPEIEKSEMGRNLSEDHFLTTKDKDVTHAINKMMLDEAMRASIIDDIYRQSDIRLPSRDEGHAPDRPLTVPANSTYYSLDCQMSLLPKWQEESKEHDMEMKASAHSQNGEGKPKPIKPQKTLKEKNSIPEEYENTQNFAFLDAANQEKDVTYAINKMMLDEAMSASIIDEQCRQSDIRIPSRDEGHSPYRPLSVPAKSTYYSLDSQMSLLPKWQEESKEHDMEMKASAHSQKDDFQPISFKSKMTLTGKDSVHEEHTKAKKVEDQPISPDTQNTLTETDGISKEYVKTTKDEGQPTSPKTEKALREIHDIHDDIAYAQRVERISPTSQHHFIDHDEKEYTNTQYVSQRVSTQNKNLEFYQNKIKSGIFAGTTIEEMLEWKGNYWELEINHSYIQWLFPIPEGNGLNPYAQALQEHEAEAIRSDHVLKSRVLKAYEMMLDFYGMELISPETGGVKRSKNWRDRFEHLSRSTHNNMRITRILKSLGQLGYQHFQLPWLTFILHEAIGEGTLTRLHESSVWHWINALTREEDRDHIFKTYEMLTGKPPEADLNESNGDE